MKTRRGFLGTLAGLVGAGATVKADTPAELPAEPVLAVPLDEAAIKAGWTRCEGTIGLDADESSFHLYYRATKQP